MSKNLLGNIVYLTNAEYTTLITNGTVTLASGTVVTYSENDTYIVPEVVDTAVTSGSTNTITSGAVYTALNSKVDKVNGKGLSTNDYTTDEKNKLSSIAKGAEVNVQSDWSVTDTNSDAFIKNKPTIPTVNNAKLTMQINGNNVQTFTANQASDATFNVTASSLGLSSAMKFGGVSSQSLVEGGKMNAGATSGEYTASNQPSYGTVYLDKAGHLEYVWVQDSDKPIGK